MAYEFEVYPDNSRPKKWRWRLNSENGRIVADSGQGYSTKQSCLDAVDRVKANTKAATIIEL